MKKISQINKCKIHPEYKGIKMPYARAHKHCTCWQIYLNKHYSALNQELPKDYKGTVRLD